MANERILISENAEVIKSIDLAYLKEKAELLSRANSAMARFSEFDETFGDTGSTTTKYNQLLADGAQSFIDAAINKIKQEFTAAGITSSAVMNVATERTEQKGNDFLKAYNELLTYLESPVKYPELKFALSDVKFVNGLAAVKAEKDLEPVKDTARNFIETTEGYELVAKAQTLVDAFNSINDYLGSKGLAKITDLTDYADFADYAYSQDRSVIELQVNHNAIFHISKKISSYIPA